MSVPKSTVDLIREWDDPSKSIELMKLAKSAVMEILRTQGGYTANDVLAKLTNPSNLAPVNHKALYILCGTTAVTVFRTSPSRLAKLLDNMVGQKLIRCIELDDEDGKMVRHYYLADDYKS